MLGNELRITQRNNCFWLDKHTQSLNEVFLWRYQYDNFELPIVEEVRIASAVETSILRRQQWKRHSPPTWKEQELFSQNSTKQPTFELSTAKQYWPFAIKTTFFTAQKWDFFGQPLVSFYQSCSGMVIWWVIKLFFGAFWLFLKKSLNLLLNFLQILKF